MKSEGIGEFPNNPLELASECNSEESFHRYSDKSLHLGLIANNKKMKSLLKILMNSIIIL